MNSFVKDFRDSIINKRKYQLFEEKNKTEDLNSATNISFPPSTVLRKLTEPSGYKDYDCWTVLFFYVNIHLDHPTYLQKCSSLDSTKGKEMGSVSFMDRRDLSAYLTGKIDTSSNVKQPIQEKDQTEIFGFDLNAKRKAVPEATLKDIDFVKRIKSLHRTINNPRSVLCISGPKNFANIEKWAIPLFSEQSQRDGSKSASERKVKIPLPIIIVPAAAQSLLTLFNVKEFLIDQKFVDADELRSRGDKKPISVEITRDPKKVPTSAAKKFLVIDSVDKLTREDWDRIVAVFASGQEWQFKNWKWPKPVEIFSKIMGFSLKFQDDPPAGLLNQWNVTQLQINRNRRYLDAMVVHNFWTKLDQFITTNKPQFLNKDV